MENNSSLERLGKKHHTYKPQEPIVYKLPSQYVTCQKPHISSATLTGTLDAYHLLSVQIQNKKLHHSYTDINMLHYRIMLTYEFKYSYTLGKKSMYNTILSHHFPLEYSIIIAQVKHTKVLDNSCIKRQIYLFFSVVLMTAATTFSN
jgi:predicted nucleic acid-binding Zn finger protein